MRHSAALHGPVSRDDRSQLRVCQAGHPSALSYEITLDLRMAPRSA